jgi:hypothetical protein
LCDHSSHEHATLFEIEHEDDDEDEYDCPVRGDNLESIQTGDPERALRLVPGGRVELPTKGL